MENKLLQFQQEVEKIKKTNTNPFFKSKYFDINQVLSEVKPILNKLGLVVLQPLTTVDGKPALKTIIRDESLTLSADLINETIVIPENPDPQKMGSAITYFRRYALVSALGLEGEEDDDGNSSSGNQSNNTSNFKI